MGVAPRELFHIVQRLLGLFFDVSMDVSKMLPQLETI
jgi:hypothetical protein